jgi:hypothetical protein
MVKNNFNKYSSIKSTLVYSNIVNFLPSLISISIPTSFNRPYTLLECLDSVYNQNVEKETFDIVIVVNSDVTEETIDNFVKDLKNKVNEKFNLFNLYFYKNSQNIGMVGNWNRCIELSKTEWVSLLHDDDLLTLEFLAFIKRIFKKKINIDWISSNHGSLIKNTKDYTLYESNPRTYIKSKYVKQNRKSNRLLRLKPFDNLFSHNNIYLAPTSGTFFKTAPILTLGGFDEDFFPSFDWYFTFNLSKKFKVYKTNKVLGIYRLDVNASLQEKVILGLIEKFSYFYLTFSNINAFYSYINKYFFNEKTYFFMNWINNLPLEKSGKFKKVDPVNVNNNKIHIYKIVINIYWKTKILFSRII